jgi:crotonobetainyl-CoA:carnitine CoA-transferase CaiB-like acyl-CoA transferase
MVLADLGADVVKIESFPDGDDARRLAPHVNGESYPFAMVNRNKRSIALDLKRDEGRELFLRMARDADLVVENFRPGVVGRLGVDYDAVRAVRDDILYCSISGFGQTGPYRHRPGFDIIAQGFVGFMTMTGQPDGPPNKVGIAINDVAAGVTAVYSILAAEMVRARGGGGQYLDISLVDAGLAWTVWESGAYFGAGEIPAPVGTRHRYSAPYQAFRTRDGHVTIGANNERLWKRFVTEVMKRPEWLLDPRFVTLAERLANVAELAREIEAITTTQTTSHWLEELDRTGIPGGPVLTYDEALAHPHTVAREMIVDVEHPTIGRVRTLAPPTRFSALELSVRRPAPLLGQHTAEVLRQNGIAEEEIERLHAAGVVFDQPPQ